MVNQSLSAPASLCILRLSAIGDVTHVLPIIHTLQQEWPTTKITWVIGGLEATLVGDLPGVEFIIFNKAAGFSAYRDLYRKLKGRRFDVLLHMQAALRASLASLCIRAAVKVGYDRARAIDGQWLFTNRKIAPTKSQHVLDTFFEFLKVIGIHNAHYQWPLTLSPADLDYAHNTLGNAKMMIAINPCTSVRVRNFREWPVEHYADTIEYLLKHYDCKVVLTGGPNDKERGVGLSIEKAVGNDRLVNCIGSTSLRQLAALLKQAVVVLSPDTGPAHIANAVGTPVVGLYASSNPDRTGPYRRQFVVNRYPDALEAEGYTVDSVKWGKRVRNPHVMSLITVEEVVAKLDEAIKEASAKPEVI